MAPDFGAARFAGSFEFERAELQILCPMQLVAEGEQSGIGKGGRRERDAKREAVLLQSGRDRDRGEIEEVHEVGVVAEIAVQADRVGEKLGDRVVAAGGRGERGRPWNPTRRQLARCSAFSR